MASAGTVTVTLDANGMKLIRELNKAQTHTKRTSQKMAADMGRAFGRITKAAAVMGVGLAGAFTTKVVRSTIEQQKAVAQLEASLKSTGKYTKETSEEMQKYAAALQQVSTFGDEAIIGAQSLLLTFKSIGEDVLPRTTLAVVDMATKMGMDLKSASIQLGKALNDPATGLSMLTRVGITFSDEQKNVIKSLQETGDLAGAQAVILKELESQFGGSARAARETFGGALDALKNNFGDLFEVSGDDSKGVVKSLNDLADTLAKPEVKEGFQNLAQDALGLVAALAELPGTFGFLKDEIRAFFSIIDDDDMVRRMDEIYELEQQLQTARDKSTNVFGMENRMWQARATSLEREIALKKELLEADQLFPEIKVTAQRSTPDFSGNTQVTVDPQTILNPLAEQENADKINAVIEKMMSDIKMFGMTDDEKALVKLLDEGATADQINLVKQLQSELAALQAQEEIANTELEEIVVTAKRIEPELETANQSAINLMATLESSATNAFMSMIDGSKSAKEAFSDMAKAIVADLARMIIQQMIFNAISRWGGGTVQSDVSGMMNTQGMFAEGGNFFKGDPIIVGERGPELIVPRTAGTVIPNHDLDSGGGVTVNIDARESDDPGRLLALVPIIQQQIESSIALKQRRGYM